MDSAFAPATSRTHSKYRPFAPMSTAPRVRAFVPAPARGSCPVSRRRRGQRLRDGRVRAARADCATHTSVSRPVRTNVPRPGASSAARISGTAAAPNTGFGSTGVADGSARRFRRWSDRAFPAPPRSPRWGSRAPSRPSTATRSGRGALADRLRQHPPDETGLDVDDAEHAVGGVDERGAGHCPSRRRATRVQTGPRRRARGR